MKIFAYLLFLAFFSSLLHADFPRFSEYSFKREDYIAALQKQKQENKLKPPLKKLHINRNKETLQFLQIPFSHKLPVMRSFSDDSVNPHRGLLFTYSTTGHVKSSLSGKVVVVDYMEGYDNYIILEHNNKLTTIYAHLDHITVKEGDYIHRGKMLGTLIKNKGLYFQINKDKKALNPTTFLKE
ncbi:MAG: M23 family metallopeptidase [Leptospiraceae bacterium]|nr:M23 family metallopeptidase [Leptospiraceae bacterium]MCP5498752.1 M23 family metallopeptidase [Leptospiraceae bacterium]